jgi:multidrug resistance efflux pump
MTLAYRIALDRAEAAERRARELRAKLSIADQTIGALRSQIERLELDLAIERGEIKTVAYYQETQGESES